MFFSVANTLLLCVGVTDRWFNDGDFIWGKDTLTEGILAIALVDHPTTFDCHAYNERHCVWA